MITPADKSMLCTNSGIVPNSQSQTSWTPTFDVAAANATENMENMTAMASGAKSVSSDTPSSRARTPLSPRSPTSSRRTSRSTRKKPGTPRARPSPLAAARSARTPTPAGRE